MEPNAIMKTSQSFIFEIENKNKDKYRNTMAKKCQRLVFYDWTKYSTTFRFQIRSRKRFFDLVRSVNRATVSRGVDDVRPEQETEKKNVFLWDFFQ